MKNPDPIQEIAGMLREFAAAREWDQYHTPKNLAAAMSVEAAEVLEHFQWLTDEQSLAIDPARRTAVSHELADVMLYLIRLADKLGIDLCAPPAKRSLSMRPSIRSNECAVRPRNTTSSDDAALFRDVQGLRPGIAAQPDRGALEGRLLRLLPLQPVAGRSEFVAQLIACDGGRAADRRVARARRAARVPAAAEFQAPRLHAMRYDDRNTQRAVIVELKQWDRCESADPENVVRSWVGGRNRTLLHPSVQVGQYRQYLEDTHTAFHEGPNPIVLSACHICTTTDRGR